MTQCRYRDVELDRRQKDTRTRVAIDSSGRGREKQISRDKIPRAVPMREVLSFAGKDCGRLYLFCARCKYRADGDSFLVSERRSPSV